MRGKTPRSVVEQARKDGARMVDLKFTDPCGAWQHFTIPIRELAEESFAEGFRFDDSVPRGWSDAGAGDLTAIPDPDTTFMDPFCAVPTLSATCTVCRTDDRKASGHDPRGIARRAERYLATTGLADTAVFGSPAEFFIFDGIRYDSKPGGCFYEVDSEEAGWNIGRDELPNLGDKIRLREGRFPVAPADTHQDLRTEMCLILEELGVPVVRQHHGSATAGQARFDFRSETLVRSADRMMLCKYVVRNVARRHGKTVTFMPQPIHAERGNGMPIHQSWWRRGKPLFAGQKRAGLSRLALNYIGGILKHARALAAFCNPTTNSYKRLAAADHAPLSVGYSVRNSSAAIRLPAANDGPKARQIEYQPPDPSANPYLCYTALLLAGIDGVIHQIDPGDPTDPCDADRPPVAGATGIPLPGNLAEAAIALERDYEFLLQGGVFSRDFVEMWVRKKRQEHASLELRPHPHEFQLYYDC